MYLEEMSAEQLTALGYRRVSNRHGHVSRIDCPDWKELLADHLNKSLAQIEKDITKEPGAWEDFYRRVLSKDVLVLSKFKARNIPTSSWDSTGYIKKEIYDSTDISSISRVSNR